MAEVKTKREILEELTKTVKRAKIAQEILAREKERNVALAESEETSESNLED